MGLKHDLSKIANEKEEKKKQYKKIKNRYITIIYAGLCKRKSIKEIHKALYNATINKKSPILKQAMIEAVKIKKKVDNKKDTKYIADAYGVVDPFIMLSIAVFDTIKKENVDKEINTIITEQVDKRESEMKLEALESAMASDNIFYLASSHDDCAKDHLQAQGKMYYNENWKSEIDSTIAYQEILNYILKHKLKTVQEITGKPVYFITRPNCRHYFREIPVKEVLQTNINTLTKRYDMHTKIGKRTYVQTLKTDKLGRKLVGEVRNAELVIKKYRERLLLFKAMYDEQPNPVIKNAIMKTQTLLQKWNEYLEKMKKYEKN